MFTSKFIKKVWKLRLEAAKLYNTATNLIPWKICFNMVKNGESLPKIYTGLVNYGIEQAQVVLKLIGLSYIVIEGKLKGLKFKYPSIGQNQKFAPIRGSKNYGYLNLESLRVL